MYSWKKKLLAALVCGTLSFSAIALPASRAEAVDAWAVAAQSLGVLAAYKSSLASILALGLTKVGLWAFGNALAEAAALYQTTIVLTLPAWRDCAVFVVFCAVTGGIVASFAALDLWRRVR